MEKIVGIIPVRYASTRLPGKPLIKICGTELIVHVHNMAKKVKELSEIYVATDDDRIRKVCIDNGIQTIMTSEDCSSGTDRICEAVKQIKADYIINIQGDEPLFEPHNISKLIEYHKHNTSIDVINVMTEIKNPFEINDTSVVKVAFNDNNDLIYLSRATVPSCKIPGKTTYYKHCGIYGLTQDALCFFESTSKGRLEKSEDIEMFRFLENGKNVKIIVVETDSIGIDTPNDVLLAEAKMKKVDKL